MTQDQQNDEQEILEKDLLELEQQGLKPAESLAFFQCREEYRLALLLIGRYDEWCPELTGNEEKPLVLEIKTVKIIIENLKKYLQKQGENMTHFGVENTGNIDSIIGAVYQTYAEKDLYPDMESKAANLLYLLVKDHCFVDGNKRIAAFLFIWFLDMNGKLYVAQDEPVISYILIYKLTIFIAESDPKHKDVMISLISHIISFPREIPPDLITA